MSSLQPTPTRPSLTNVTDFLSDDHRRLDAILEDVKRLAAAGDFAGAAARYREFDAGLDHHIDIEETILFPSFEEHSGMRGGGPTEVMRHEHVQIRRHMDEIREALVAADRGAVEAAARELDAVLGEHNMKEENILYPMSDRFAGSDAGRLALVDLMRAHPERRRPE